MNNARLLFTTDYDLKIYLHESTYYITDGNNIESLGNDIKKIKQFLSFDESPNIETFMLIYNDFQGIEKVCGFSQYLKDGGRIWD
jgi:hypothetical protein